MTIVQILLAVKSSLQSWAEQISGDVMIAIDATQMWELGVGAINQDAPSIILAFNGQENRGEESIQDVSGRVFYHFTAMIVRARGYDRDVGDDLVGQQGAAVGGTIPFYDLIEQARDAIRSCPIVTEGDTGTEGPVWVRGIEKVPYDADNPLYAYKIEFTVGTDIGDVIAGNLNQ